MAWDTGHRVGMINAALELIPFQYNLKRALQSKVGFKTLKERIYAGTLDDYISAMDGKSTKWISSVDLSLSTTCR